MGGRCEVDSELGRPEKGCVTRHCIGVIRWRGALSFVLLPVGGYALGASIAALRVLAALRLKDAVTKLVARACPYPCFLAVVVLRGGIFINPSDQEHVA